MILYSRNVKDDQTATYDCGLCGNYELDVDSARAHQAVHVAGPELLASLKKVVALSDRKHDAWDEAHAAIAKAEPKGQPDAPR